MENYKKGKNIEEPLDRDNISIPNLPFNFLWMQVRGGSKIRILLVHALNEMPEAKHVVWTGFGPSVGKAVTCAEIMKREYDNRLHQITKLCYRQVEEYWDPLVPELDQIVVKRKLPMIHVYLSTEPLDVNELGYQAPGTTITYNCKDYPIKKPHKTNRNRRKPSSKAPGTSSRANDASSSNVDRSQGESSCSQSKTIDNT